MCLLADPLEKGGARALGCAQPRRKVSRHSWPALPEPHHHVCLHTRAPGNQVYGERFSRQARQLDIREAVIAPRSPWQNSYAERVIGSIRRECLNHVVVLSERHLREILSKYVDYYNRTRTHLSLAKDAPESRSVQPPSQGRVVQVPRVGGLHHEYLRRAA